MRKYYTGPHNLFVHTRNIYFGLDLGVLIQAKYHKEFRITSFARNILVYTEKEMTGESDVTGCSHPLQATRIFRTEPWYSLIFATFLIDQNLILFYYLRYYPYG